MVYGDQADSNPLGLHMPDMRRLASSMTVRPSEEIQGLIRAGAQRMREKTADRTVNPYWLWAEIHQTHRNVTINQVAWVLVQWVQIRRKR